MADLIFIDFGGEHDVKGDATRAGYEDQIEAQSFSVSGGSHVDRYHWQMSADASIGISFTKPVDGASAPMMDAFYKTQLFAKVTITVLRKEGPEVVKSMVFELEQAYLTSFGYGTSAGSGASGDTETWSLEAKVVKTTGKGNKMATYDYEQVTAAA